MRKVSRRGRDVMGYTRASGLEGYTDDDIRAARLLAKAAGFEWDCVLTDPRVHGKRYLEPARTVRLALIKAGWSPPPDKASA